MTGRAAIAARIESGFECAVRMAGNAACMAHQFIVRLQDLNLVAALF